MRVTNGTSYAEASVALTNPIQQYFNLSVSPSSASVARNSTRQFTAVIDTNIGAASHAVTWSITSSGSHRSTINTSGLLSVPNNENQVTSITVRATASYNGAVATAAVTIT